MSRKRRLPRVSTQLYKSNKSLTDRSFVQAAGRTALKIGGIVGFLDSFSPAAASGKGAVSNKKYRFRMIKGVENDLISC